MELLPDIQPSESLHIVGTEEVSSHAENIEENTVQLQPQNQHFQQPRTQKAFI